MFLWEILVPTMKDGVPVRTRFHREWDRRVRAVAGGLTIMHPARGQWIAPDGTLFSERMIPVRIMCGRDSIEKIADITAQHYNQQAVMFYRVSDEVEIKNYA